MWIWYLFLTMPTLIHSSAMSNCHSITDIYHKLDKLHHLILVMCFGSFESALIIFIYFITNKDCLLWSVHLTAAKCQRTVGASDSTTSELSCWVSFTISLISLNTLTLKLQQGNCLLIQSSYSPVIFFILFGFLLLGIQVIWHFRSHKWLSASVLTQYLPGFQWSVVYFNTILKKNDFHRWLHSILYNRIHFSLYSAINMT